MFDLLIKNAKVVDGTSAPWYYADVAVKDGKIAKIGRIAESEATKVVDAKRNVLAPGFVDIHSHSDAEVLKYKLNESRILQGITTELGGDCGISPMPVNPEKMELLEKYIEFVSDVKIGWSNTKEFLDKIEKSGTSVNFAMAAGHGTIRLAAMGFEDREPTASELELMRKFTAECMEQGCYGLSSGLIYPPGSYAKNEEIIELAKVVSQYGGFYESHMRWEGSRVIESVEETIDVGVKANLPVQIAHHKVTDRNSWNCKSHATTALIAKSRGMGLDVTVDQYPYTATATTLTTKVPEWAHEGGLPKMLERLKDPTSREKIEASIRSDAAKNMRGWANLYVSSVRSEKNAWVMGKNIEEIAKELGKDPVDTVIHLLIEEEGVVSQISFCISEEDVAYIMQQPFVMIGSDGGACSLNVKAPPSPQLRYFPKSHLKVLPRPKTLFSGNGHQ